MSIRSGLLALCLPACAPPPVASSTWVADRTAGELIALDEELCVSARVPVPSPRLLVAAGGALWVGTRPPHAPAGSARLVRVDPCSRGTLELDCGEIVALCAEPGGEGVLALERIGERETLLWRVGPREERALLGAFADARALAATTDALLVGCAGGDLVRLRPHGAVEASAALDEPVCALASGPRAGEWWVLAGSGPSTLALVDRALVPLWSVRTGLDARRLAVVAGEERVWVAAAQELRCYGPGGKLEHARALPSGAWEAGVATRAKVLLMGVGALLELSVRGARVTERRTQGGFSRLVDVTGRARVNAR